MPLRVKCPRCGRLEEYELDEEDLAGARKAGLSSISFYHADHILLVYFDASGGVRRVTVMKSVKMPKPPPPPRAPPEVRPPRISPMPFEDLVRVVGKERLALTLAALSSGGRLVLSSSARDLADKVCAALELLLEPLGLSVERAPDEGSLMAVADKPPGTIIVADKNALAGGVELPPGALAIDLDSSASLDMSERKALTPILKTLEEASSFVDEGPKIAIVRSRLLVLKALVEKAVDVLGKVKVVGEAMLKKSLNPDMSSDELRLLLYLLGRFRGVDVESRVLRGARERFLVPRWMERL